MQAEDPAAGRHSAPSRLQNLTSAEPRSSGGHELQELGCALREKKETISFKWLGVGTSQLRHEKAQLSSPTWLKHRPRGPGS